VRALGELTHLTTKERSEIFREVVNWLGDRSWTGSPPKTLGRDKRGERETRADELRAGREGREAPLRRKKRPFPKKVCLKVSRNVSRGPNPL
jgi:hypothetical protein